MVKSSSSGDDGGREMGEQEGMEERGGMMDP